jgi:hypothetical protein
VVGEHEPHVGQNLQVGRDGGLADVDRSEDLADAHRGAAPGQQGHHLDPAGVRERLEPAGELGGCRPVEGPLTNFIVNRR